MASKTLEVVQKILEHLDNSMDDDKVDMSPVSAEALGISDARWHRIIGMMKEECLIDGFGELKALNANYSQYKPSRPRITLRGLQFLSENSNAARLYGIAKEIKGWIPGLN